MHVIEYFEVSLRGLSMGINCAISSTQMPTSTDACRAQDWFSGSAVIWGQSLGLSSISRSLELFNDPLLLLLFLLLLHLLLSLRLRPSYPFIPVP